MEVKPLLEIYIKEDGVIGTRFYMYEGFSPYKMGIALGSATRVITEAFLDHQKLDQGHREQIEAIIADAYNKDLQLGDCGEQDSTSKGEDI